MTSSKRWPGEMDETFPDVFNVKAMPAPSSAKKPGQLPPDKIRQFFEEGYVVVDSYLDPRQLDACLAAVEGVVDELAHMLHEAGKITDLHKDAGVFQRLTLLDKQFPGANILMMKLGRFPQAFRDIWSDDALLNCVEQLIGPEISGHPVWNLRCKVPQNEVTTVPWHQDAAYMDTRSYDVLQVTAWVPLLDATPSNGCLEFAARGHRKGKVAQHTCCWGDTFYIALDEGEMADTLGVDLEKDVKLCPVPYGGMVLFNNLIPHRSLPNLSTDIRWSLDLRWQRSDRNPGFHDVKEGVRMRSRVDPVLAVDWESFMGVNRADAEAKLCKSGEDPRFNTTMPGPWMRQWEITHSNRHTEALGS